MARTKDQGERQFVSIAGKLFEFTKAVANEVYDLGGHDSDLSRVVSDKQLRRAIAELIAGEKAETFPVVVNYDMTLAAMIAAGRYNFINDSITDEHFPLQTGVGSVEVTIQLVHFNRYISSDDAISELDRQGLRPVWLEELLAFGAAYPENQREFPVVALGSVWRGSDGRRGVPCLWSGSDGRDLRLGWCGGGWDGRCRVAAVRK